MGLGALGNALDTASSILGGPAQGGAGAAAPVTPVFRNGENLGERPEDMGGAQPPNDQTVHDIGAPIEFIHFGYVHPDSSLHFVHPNIADDTKTPKLGEGPGSRAIMFRDALEREVILLGGFIDYCQKVLKEKEDSQGGLGQAMAFAGSLLGGGAGDSGPKAADLNSIFSSAQSAATPINTGSIEYKPIHQAGIDLQTARQQYQEFRKKLQQPPSDGGGGLLGQVQALAGAAGEAGKILKIVQGVAFKAFDIYVRTFAEIAGGDKGGGKDAAYPAWEQVIESACHAMTIAAIKGNVDPDTATPIFPVWFPKPADQQQAAPSSYDSGVAGDAEKEIDGVKKTVKDAQKDVKDFLEGEPVDCPGTAFLVQAFSLSLDQDDHGKPVLDQPPKPPQDPGAPVIAAFKAVLKIDDSLPGFLETLIKEIMQLNTDFIQAVYQKLMQTEPKASIDARAMFEAGRKRMLQRLLNMLLDQVAILKKLATGSFNVQDQKVGPGHFIDQGMDLLNQKFASQLDVVLQITMKELAEELQAARKNAQSNKSLTMEAYLGVLPYLLAVLFRDTFFPIWDMVMKEVFATIGGPVGSAVNAALDAMKSIKSVVDTARDYKKRAEAMPKVAGDALSRGVGTGDKSGNIAQDQDDFNKAKALEADRGSGSWDSGGGKAPDAPPFPLSGRLPAAKGVDITLDEWNQVKPNWKYIPTLPSGP